MGTTYRKREDGFVAWSVWRIKREEEKKSSENFADNFFLFPPTATFLGPWIPGQPREAQCVRHDLDAHKASSCAWPMDIVAFGDEEQALRFLRSPSSRSLFLYGRDLIADYMHGEIYGIGRVLLWGDITIEKFELRAQYAYPLELVVHNDRNGIAESIGVRYEIPVSVAEESLVAAKGAWLMQRQNLTKPSE